MTIRRWIGFILQPESISSTASQSSKAGWVGGLPLTPKSNSVGTRGVPKCRIQIWLMATRAVSGFLRLGDPARQGQPAAGAGGRVDVGPRGE